MKKVLIPMFAVVSAVCFSSCFNDKIVVGTVAPDEPLVHVASVRNPHFIGGLVVSHDKTKKYVPKAENYVIGSKTTFWDGVVSGVTFGIYTPTTTKYYVPKSDPNVVIKKKKWGSKTYKGYLKE